MNNANFNKTTISKTSSVRSTIKPKVESQRAFTISHSSVKVDAKVNILPYTWQVPGKKYTYQSCKTAVNIKV